MRKILQKILKILAKNILKKYQPLVIGITGSIGKSSAKEAVFSVLKTHFKVRRTQKNYNNELGVPLTIIGGDSGQNSFLKWAKVIFRGLNLIIFKKNYPDILILEMGADRPGDISYLTQLAQPKTGVVTAIGQFPVHVEFFPETDKLIEEKSKLIESLSKNGTAVLNYDDLSVRSMRDKTKGKVITYGFGQGADLTLSEFKQNFVERKASISFKAEYGGGVVPIRISRTLGKQQAYAAGSAIAVGLSMGLNLVEISNVLKKYRPLPGRTSLLRGIKKTWLIDDTYNSSPTASIAALDLLNDFPIEETEGHRGRKIAVLADMLELGQYVEEGHRYVGQKAAEVADILFVVGPRAQFIAEEAKKAGLPEERIFKFMEAKEAGLVVQEKMRPADLVLIKGSRSMKMERVVKEIMAHPKKAKKLLVH